MEATAAPLDPTLILVLALIPALATILGPIAVALINRTGRAQPDPPSIDLVAELDHDLDEVARDLQRATRDNERLGRENDRLTRENDTLIRENDRLRQQMGHTS